MIWLFPLIVHPYTLIFLYAAASHLDEEQSESGDSNIPADRKPKKTSILDKITAQTVKQILELLCDESVSVLLRQLSLEVNWYTYKRCNFSIFISRTPQTLKGSAL